MKTAIVYYSMSGNTQQTAERIASILGGELIRLVPVKEYPSTGMKKFLWGGKSALMGEKPKLQPYAFDDSFDRIILGSPVWASNIAPPLRTFISENIEKLKGKELSAFVCYSGGGAEKAIGKLKALSGVESLSAELILIDPKDHPTSENEQKIEAFCRSIL